MPSDNACVPSSIIRPMLPPLCTLGFRAMRETDNDLSSEPIVSPTLSEDSIDWHRAPRQGSVLSTTSSCTTITSEQPRYSSPVFERGASTPPPSQVSTDGFTLVVTSFEKANAFVVVPPYVPNISCLSRANASPSSSHSKPRRNQALLLVGPAVDYLRHSRMQIAKGARVHPYRIVSNTRRRSSESLSPEPSETAGQRH